MISINDLRRSFGSVIAVDGVSFSVEKGQVLGFLGPNGAGKSTVMKMLACFLKPDSGTASICGYDILKNPTKVRQSIGYLAENVPAYNEMTVGGFLNFVCAARQIRLIPTGALPHTCRRPKGTGALEVRDSRNRDRQASGKAL